MSRFEHKGWAGSLSQRIVGVVAILAMVASVAAGIGPRSAQAVGNIEEIHSGSAYSADYDARIGQIAPSAAQKQIASNLNAAVRWNKFGTLSRSFVMTATWRPASRPTRRCSRRATG
ncbi:MAG: hypothetical protein WKH64_15095 [Chloroflexia bacterium]